jgi:UDP-N-acetylmuramate--alanine ligase
MIAAKLKYVYLIGIGGIGMSGLARYFRSAGKAVSGYDKTPSSLTDEMEQEGIAIHFDDSIEKIGAEIKNHPSPDDTLIIYTPAVPQEHSELQYFRQGGFNIMKRADVLGAVSQGHYLIAVAGTHGKTTTTTLVTHILKSARMDCAAFLGGVSKNYNTNVLTGGNNSKGAMVVEADEYDRSFLKLNPDIAVITSTDPDHLDIYGDRAHVREGYSLFAKRLKRNGTLVTKQKLINELEYSGSAVTYSLEDGGSNFYAKNISVLNGSYTYDVVTPHGEIKSVKLGVGGMHNIENSVAAAAVALLLEVDSETIRMALETFKGVKRRFDYQINTPELVYIDDYAHHPAELKACISSVKALYPGKKVTGIFQPHLFTRTRDFADDFARSLELLDSIILLDIYPARELPIPGIDSAMLLKKINNPNKKLCTRAGVLDAVTRNLPEVLITMGAGDIDRLVEPLKEALLRQTEHA